jgi:hypothetical protein
MDVLLTLLGALVNGIWMGMSGGARHNIISACLTFLYKKKIS